jgi:hypothetical protein
LRKYWPIAFVFAAVLILAFVLNHFVSHRAIEMRRLADSRTKWSARDIDDYRFRLSSRGAWGHGTTVIVTVRDGTVASTDPDRGTLQPDAAACAAPSVTFGTIKPCNTIPDMFDRIADMLGHRGARTTVRYHRYSGVPENIYYDLRNASDEEFTVFIGEFTSLD